mmetsp:Transcript_8757/g.18861  ORF Transcript_8757/g.18861 Transcript_8757/m.18861 type:complete len:208 (+) Transcript_8757:893-1516(+)
MKKGGHTSSCHGLHGRERVVSHVISIMLLLLLLLLVMMVRDAIALDDLVAGKVQRVGRDAPDEHGLHAAPQPFDSRVVAVIRYGTGGDRRRGGAADPGGADHSVGRDVLDGGVSQRPAPFAPGSFQFVLAVNCGGRLRGQIHDVGRISCEGVNVRVRELVAGGMAVMMALPHEVLHRRPDSLVLRAWVRRRNGGVEIHFGVGRGCGF